MPAGDEKLKIIAVLHDVIEDNPNEYSFDYLSEEGFGKDITVPLVHLTRSKGENVDSILNTFVKELYRN